MHLPWLQDINMYCYRYADFEGLLSLGVSGSFVISACVSDDSSVPIIIYQSEFTSISIVIASHTHVTSY